MRPVKLLALVLGLAAVLAIAACGGDDGGEDAAPGDGAETQAAEDGALDTVRVGVIPIADVAPLFLGQSQGFFEEEGIEIQPEFAQGGAAIVPSVVSGEFQFGFSNTTSEIIAASEGLDVRIVTNGVLGGTDESEAWAYIWVKEDSPVQEPQDLEGMTIAANTLRNVVTLTANASLANEGVDISTIEYTEIPFPDMVAALEADRVPAIYTVEPFSTIARQAGHRSIIAPLVATASDYIVATYFTTQEMIDEDPELVERFRRAMNRSLDYAAENPDEARQAVTEFTEIPPEVVEAMTLPEWTSELDPATIELTVDLALEYGYIEEAPDLDELIYEGE